MSYAVIKSGGKQYKVKSGQILKVEKLPDSKPAQKVEEVPETPVEVTRQLETAPIVEQGSRGQALIVEDSAPIRKMLKRILERAGFRVDEAGNGEQGLDIFSRSESEIEGLPIATDEQYEYLRTLHGIPKWGSELDFGQMPQEAGIENETISYSKGCYIGQEVISRMKRAGKVPRYLTKFIVPPGTNPPCTIYHNGVPAGEITTVVDLLAAESASLALGYRRRKFKDTESFDLQPGTEAPGSFQVTVRTP